MVDRFEAPVELTGPLSPAQIAAETKAETKADTTTTETTTTEQTATESRPEWLDTKFKSPEELQKAYKELEKKFHQGQHKNPAAATETKAAESGDLTIPENTSSEDAAAQALDSVGLDINEFSSEYAQAGKLSDDSFTKLEKAGIPRAYVDQYIAGQQALQEQSRQTIYNEVGGADNFKSMSTWASANLSNDEREAVNTALASGDMEAAKLAVSGLFSRYTKANGKEPNLVNGTAGTASGDIFESTAQVTKAISDPRYKTDASYRNSVQQKLGRSKGVIY